MPASLTGVETVAVFPPVLGLALYVQRFEDDCCSKDDFWDLERYGHRIDGTSIARYSEIEKHRDPFTSTTCLLLGLDQPTTIRHRQSKTARCNP